jgi:hypothetical protein
VGFKPFFDVIAPQVRGFCMDVSARSPFDARLPRRATAKRWLVTALTAGAMLIPVAASSAPATETLRRIGQTHFQGQPSYQRTDRFVMVHDTAPRAAKNAGRLLGLTRHMFYASLEGHGFDLKPIDQPLVCLVFADKDAFVRYGKAADKRDMSWSGGYYSSRTNRVALYESPAYRLPNVVPDHRKLIRDDGTLSPNATGGNNIDNKTDNPTLGSDASVVATLARTTHEAAHQLAFNSGLQKRGVMYPFWVSEGLATMFELNEHSALGPAAANTRRRQSLIQTRDAAALVPIEQFIAQTRIATDNQQTVSQAYAQAWGLFRFLLKERPDAMHHYLDRLKRASSGRRSEMALRDDFTAAFGRMAEVKEAWQRWLARLD